MPQRFFILGCQRSGTTLLRLILEVHPDVFCYDEITAYDVLAGKMPEYTPYPVLYTGFKIPRYTEQLTSETLCDEGLAGSCGRFYSGENILFLVRDVYDTIASMYKLRFEERNWCELWVPRILQSKIERVPGFHKQFGAELDLIESMRTERERLLGQAALYWKYKTEALLRYREAGFPTMLVAYEQLVGHTEAVMRRISRHLDIPYDPRFLRHQEYDHAELFEDGSTVGATDPFRPIQNTSLNQSRRYLSDQDREQIARIVGDLPAKLAAVQS